MLSRLRQPRPQVPADPRAGAIIAAVIVSCAIVNAASHAIGLSFIAGAYLAIGIVAAVASVWLSFLMWREGHELFAMRSIWPLPLLILWIAGFHAIDEWAASTAPALFEAARGLGKDVPSQFMPWWGTAWFKFAGLVAIVGGRAFQFWLEDRN